jgi:hypothetical protein
MVYEIFAALDVGEEHRRNKTDETSAASGGAES